MSLLNACILNPAVYIYINSSSLIVYTFALARNQCSTLPYKYIQFPFLTDWSVYCCHGQENAVACTHNWLRPGVELHFWSSWPCGFARQYFVNFNERAKMWHRYLYMEHYMAQQRGTCLWYRRRSNSQKVKAEYWTAPSLSAIRKTFPKSLERCLSNAIGCIRIRHQSVCK